MAENDNLLPSDQQSGVLTESKLRQFWNALQGAFVGRSNNGIATGLQDLGTKLKPWRKLFVNEIDLAGTNVNTALKTGEINGILQAPQLTAIEPTSNLPDAPSSPNFPSFLSYADNSTSVTIKASSTNPIELIIDGSIVTIESDIEITGLSTAPSTKNTATPDSDNMGTYWGHYIGEQDIYSSQGTLGIPLKDVGTNVTKLQTKRIAFLNSSNNEIISGELGTNSVLLDVYRRWALVRGTTNNELCSLGAISKAQDLTLLNTAYIFIRKETNGNASTFVTYNQPYYTPTPPFTSLPEGQTDQYWYDTANKKWKEWSTTANAFVSPNVGEEYIPIAEVYISSAKIVGFRCYDLLKDFSSENNSILFNYSIDGPSFTRDSSLSVYGSSITFPNGAAATLEDAGFTGDDKKNGTFFLYADPNNSLFYSKERPQYRPDLKGYYSRQRIGRCVAHGRTNNSGNFIISRLEDHSFFTTFYPYQKYHNTEKVPTVFSVKASYARSSGSNRYDIINDQNFILKSNNVRIAYQRYKFYLLDGIVIYSAPSILATPTYNSNQEKASIDGRGDDSGGKYFVIRTGNDGVHLDMIIGQVGMQALQIGLDNILGK